MEKILNNISNAQKRIKTADYMLTMTYETVKEPKLLLTITNTTFLAVKEIMLAALYYERYFKRIPPFNEDSFEVQLDIFKQNLGEKYKIDKADYELINTLRRVIQEHKDSAVEFSRKDNFFIMDDNYKTERLDKDELKVIISNAKVFIEKIYNIISNGK